MIYFDNAATGGFKPRAVTDAVNTVIRYLLANPGRSGHRLSLTGAQAVHQTRQILAQYFNAKEERVIFTKNCTEALNIGILGTAQKGGHVICTTFEHNSVLRPLYHLKKQGVIELDVVCPDEQNDIVSKIEEKIKPNTYLIATTAVCNVTGEELPLHRIGKLTKKNDLLFLVDGAQGGGHISLDMKELNINLLALAGHKGLLGIMGSGALIISDGTEVSPITFGGTGSESFNLNQPECYPERLECGTLNLPAICALGEGAKFIKNNQQTFATHLLNASEYLISSLKKINNVCVFSKPNRSGIVAFKLENLSSFDVADILNTDYDIAVRGGLHCSPLTHKFLGTEEDGLIRASLAVQNSSHETSFFLKAISEIASR